MKRFVGLLLVSAVASACAVWASSWTKAETTEEQRRADLRACEAEAWPERVTTALIWPIGYPMLAEKLTACMTAKGYTK